ncbi:hypothetical protein ACS0TY_034520 [Phlomoides rotata]
MLISVLECVYALGYILSSLEGEKHVHYILVESLSFSEESKKASILWMRKCGGNMRLRLTFKKSCVYGIGYVQLVAQTNESISEGVDASKMVFARVLYKMVFGKSGARRSRKTLFIIGEMEFWSIYAHPNSLKEFQTGSRQ